MKAVPLKFSIAIAGLALASSVLYLVGYWGSFEVNIFEFLSLDDLVRSAIYPLFGIASSFAFYGLLFGSMLTPGSFIDGGGTVLASIETEKHQRENDRKRRTQAVTQFRVIGGIAILVWIGYVAISKSYSQVAYALAILASVGMGLHLKNSEYAENTIKEPILRGLICTVAVLIPVTSFVHGFVRANRLIFSAGDFSFVCESDLKEPNSERLERELRFVGKADEYFFFVQDPEIDEIKVLQYDDFKRMVFRRSLGTLRGEVTWIDLLIGRKKEKVGLCLTAAMSTGTPAGR